MKYFQKCRACIAEAAKDLMEICPFRRKSDPDPLYRVHANVEKDNPYHAVDSNRSSNEFGESNTRGRRLTIIPNLQITTRPSSAPSPINSFVELSPTSYRRMPIPDLYMTLLPALDLDVYRQYSTDPRCRNPLPNIPSRTALIRACSVPQFDWTAADCRDWICVYLQSTSGFKKKYARSKASKSPENGEGLYHTSLWHWRDRMGHEAGQNIFNYLQECREKRLVLSMNPKDFQSQRFVPDYMA